jgi:lipid A 3-O-deacylase
MDKDGANVAPVPRALTLLASRARQCHSPPAMTVPCKLYCCVAACFLALAISSRAQSVAPDSAGARLGFEPNSNLEFHQAEAFVDWNLPWAWKLGSQWRIQTGLDASLGWIGDSSRDAAIATVGPLVVLSYKGFPLFLEGGSSPTALTRSEFEHKDFGIPFQFTSHIGVGLNVSRHWRIACRFQHMSNAGLASSNPGLNLYMFAVSYRF